MTHQEFRKLKTQYTEAALERSSIMSVAIRLTRVGRKKSPHYRLVVADNRFPRDGRFIEIIGYYQPLTAEIKLEVEEDRALYWLGVGAQPSNTVRSLLQRKGIMKKWHEARVEARKALKAAKAEQPA
jgi:small subunit ribosomal protein S16